MYWVRLEGVKHSMFDSLTLFGSKENLEDLFLFAIQENLAVSVEKKVH